MQDQTSFPITHTDGSTKLELLWEGDYDHSGVSRRVLKFVESDYFNFRAPKVARPEHADLIFLEFGFAPSTPDVLGEITRRGFLPPTEEDVLRFGCTYPDEQNKSLLVFLHPYYRPPGEECGYLVLGNGSSLGSVGEGRGVYLLNPLEWTNPSGFYRYKFAARVP